MDVKRLRLASQTLGGLPIVNHYLSAIDLPRILQAHLPSNDKRLKLAPSLGIGLLLRNLIVARKPLYALGEWAAPFDPRALGLEPRHVRLLNDDRVGRCLDRLFDADRPSLVLAVVVAAVRKFKVRLKELHNDSTTVSFHGKYLRADGHKVRGKPTLRITYGHSKAKRPDLKQLLYEITVCEDGTIPVHYQVHDGNITDDQTHRHNWDVLRELVGSPDFLYVADSKLCTAANLRHIADRGGRFLTVLPRTWKEDGWFRDWMQTHEVPWKALWKRPNTRGKGKPEDVYRVYEPAQGSTDGYRILWFHSSEKERQDRAEREDKLDRARRGLEELRDRLRSKRTRLRKRDKVDKAVERVLAETGSRDWIDVEAVESAQDTYRQRGPGRPGPNTAYKRQVRRRFDIHWKHRLEAIAYAAKTDGIFPLITNDLKLKALRLLRIYKRQPRLEKRHEQLKSVHNVAPQFLKGAARIEALLCVFFLALLVDALIERHVRRAMRAARIRSLPLYPEERDCRFPTTDRMLEVFESLQRHVLRKDGMIQEEFPPELSKMQRRLLPLLGVREADYTAPPV
jgi:transposase